MYSEKQNCTLFLLSSTLGKTNEPMYISCLSPSLKQQQRRQIRCPMGFVYSQRSWQRKEVLPCKFPPAARRKYSCSLMYSGVTSYHKLKTPITGPSHLMDWPGNTGIYTGSVPEDSTADYKLARVNTIHMLWAWKKIQICRFQGQFLPMYVTFPSL